MMVSYVGNAAKYLVECDDDKQIYLQFGKGECYVYNIKSLDKNKHIKLVTVLGDNGFSYDFFEVHYAKDIKAYRVLGMNTFNLKEGKDLMKCITPFLRSVAMNACGILRNRIIRVISTNKSLRQQFFEVLNEKVDGVINLDYDDYDVTLNVRKYPVKAKDRFTLIVTVER